MTETAPAPDAERKILDFLERERSVFVLMLREIRKIVGDQPFSEFFRDNNLSGESADAFLDRYPGYVAESMNRRISDPKQRVAITDATLRLFMSSDPFRSPRSADYARLSETGFLPLPNLLTSDEFAALVRDFQSRDQFFMQGTMQKHLVPDVVHAPHALKLATDKRLLFTAGEFLGCAPTIVNMEAWWSPASGIEHEPEQFHRDKDDFRACKFFMYLTDVGAEDGPHMYAQRTHDANFVSQLLVEKGHAPDAIDSIFYMGAGGRLSVKENIDLFTAQTVEVHGPAGTSFMTNSYGLHRGRPPQRGRRGMFAVTYARAPYPDRIKRFADVRLQALPADCADNPLTRHATRLLF